MPSISIKSINFLSIITSSYKYLYSSLVKKVLGSLIKVWSIPSLGILIPRKSLAIF